MMNRELFDGILLTPHITKLSIFFGLSFIAMVVVCFSAGQVLFPVNGR